MGGLGKENFMKDFILGGIAGGVAKTATAPLERIKLILQLQDASAQIGKSTGDTLKYNGFMDCLTRVYREQGLKSFWRGNFANIMRYIPTQAFNFAFKEKYQKISVRYDKKADFWKFFAVMLISGGVAGVTSMSLVFPLDFARTRLGVDVGRRIAERQYVGITDCIKKTYRNEGLLALYRGYVVSVGGVFIYRAIFFGLFDTVKALVYDDPMKSNMIVTFAIGLFAETTAGFVAYPTDTVRRRMMMQAGRTDVIYKSALDCCRKIIIYEGLGGFYKGCFSNILRGTGGAIVLVLNDEMQKALIDF